MQIGGGSGGAGASGAWEPGTPKKSIIDQINDITFGPPGTKANFEPKAITPGQSITDQINDITFGASEAKSTQGTKETISGLTDSFGAGAKTEKSTKESGTMDKSK